MKKQTKVAAGVLTGVLGIGAAGLALADNAAFAGNGGRMNTATAGRGQGRADMGQPRGGGVAGQHRGAAMGGRGAGSGPRVTVPAPAANAAAATPELVAALDEAVAEERLAQATYADVIEAFGAITPFRNIVRSEAAHISALEQVASNHGITLSATVPQTPATPGSADDACALGVATEKADIALYDRLLPTVQAWPDVVQVMTNLQSASINNHLPAFTACS